MNKIHFAFPELLIKNIYFFYSTIKYVYNLCYCIDPEKQK